MYNIVEQFSDDNHIHTNDELKSWLDINDRQLKQLMSGYFNQNLEEFVNICIRCGVVPQVTFVSIDEILKKDKKHG